MKALNMNILSMSLLASMVLCIAAYPKFLLGDLALIFVFFLQKSKQIVPRINIFHYLFTDYLWLIRGQRM